MANFTHRIQGAAIRKAIYLIFAASSLVAIAAACSSANFGGGSNSSSNNSANGTGAPGGAPGTTPGENGAGSAGVGSAGPGGSASAGTPGSTPGGPAACTTDQVKLDWTGEEKGCIDKGQTWDFDTSQCMQIHKASFDCTWPNAIAELDKKGLTTQTVKDDSAAGAKLVSCGQSQDGNRIVIQWIKVADGAAQVACNGGSSPLQHHVTTGCYTYYTNGAVPAPATTQADKDARVYSCLSSI